MNSGGLRGVMRGMRGLRTMRGGMRGGRGVMRGGLCGMLPINTQNDYDEGSK